MPSKHINTAFILSSGLLRVFDLWGTGFQRMIEMCATNGNPKPEFKEMTGAFVVKFIRKPAGEGINEGVNEGINRILEFIRKNPGKRVVEIAAASNVPSKTIERWIRKLREQGEIVFTGPRKSGGYYVIGH
jgi:ATP-dependent DNA helicase RecG